MLETIGKDARAAAKILARASSENRRACLDRLLLLLRASTAEVLAANTKDVEQARLGNLPAPFVDRLTLTEARVASMCAELQNLGSLPDPLRVSACKSIQC